MIRTDFLRPKPLTRKAKSVWVNNAVAPAAHKGLFFFSSFLPKQTVLFILVHFASSNPKTLGEMNVITRCHAR